MSLTLGHPVVITVGEVGIIICRILAFESYGRHGIKERVDVCPSLVLHGRGEDDLLALAQNQLVPLLDQRSE